MGTLFCLLILGYGLHKLVKATPGAIKFGLENHEALRGGASVLKRMFRK
jgi:hypothetical protein